MKKICFFLALSVAWIACDNNERSTQQVVGTYVGEWTNSFGKVSDRFEITQDSTDAGFQVMRITTHFRELQGKPTDTPYKRVRYAGTFNSTDNTMLLDDPAKILTFNGDTVRITGSETPYTRIK